MEIDFAAILTLLGVVIGNALTLITNWQNNRQQIRIEKLKLHDSARIKAYRRVARFARKLSGSIFPLAEDKQSEFDHIMKKYYFDDELEQDYIYFNSHIQEILDKFEDLYVSMHHPELIVATEADQDQFLKEEAFDLAQSLHQEAKKAIKITLNH